MLTDAELEQMLADAAEMQRLREKASKAPWSDDDGVIECDDGVVCHIQHHGNVNTMARCGEAYSKKDANFIAAARTDKSAAHVERLVQVVRRLKQELDDATTDKGDSCARCGRYRGGP